MQVLKVQTQVNAQPQGQYLLSARHCQQLIGNHIPIRKQALDEYSTPCFLIYVEEMAYLMMVSNLQLDRQPQLKKQMVVQHQPHSLIELYQSLSSNYRSYHNIQCVYFYLKVRKLSKLLYRQPIYLHQHLPLLGFKIFDKVADYEKRTNSKSIILVNSRHKIADVLEQKIGELNPQLIMYITSSMDGIFVKIGQPFPLSRPTADNFCKEQQ